MFPPFLIPFIRLSLPFHPTIRSGTKAYAFTAGVFAAFVDHLKERLSEEWNNFDQHIIDEAVSGDDVDYSRPVSVHTEDILSVKFDACQWSNGRCCLLCLRPRRGGGITNFPRLSVRLCVCLSVCPSVLLSVACLDITRERKGLGNLKLGQWYSHGYSVNLFRGQKVKGQSHQGD